MIKVIELKLEDIDKLPEILKKELENKNSENPIKEFIKWFNEFIAGIKDEDLEKIIKEHEEHLKIADENNKNATQSEEEMPCAEQEPQPKFKIWDEVVFDFNNKNLTPIYTKIHTLTYHEQKNIYVYNGDVGWRWYIPEEDLRFPTLPEKVKYFKI